LQSGYPKRRRAGGKVPAKKSSGSKARKSGASKTSKSSGGQHKVPQHDEKVQHQTQELDAQQESIARKRT
jgi:hypothetical protein